VLAVQHGCAIGVDVEKVRDLPQTMNIAQNCFTPIEGRMLASLHGTVQRDAFFDLWTYKEPIVRICVGLAGNLAAPNVSSTRSGAAARGTGRRPIYRTEMVDPAFLSRPGLCRRRLQHASNPIVEIAVGGATAPI
jgi:hypothetical protein